MGRTEGLWLLASLLGLATSAVYLVNAPSREAIDKALEVPSRPAVGLLTICKHGDVQDWSAYSLIAPERVLCYGPKYLQSFRASALEADTSFGDKALRRYIRPVLLWNDIAFAILMAMFAASFNIALSYSIAWSVLQSILPWLAVAGLVYGAIDVAEDLVLVKILKTNSAIGKGEAVVARTLTSLKMLTLIASVSGGVLFFGLQVGRTIYNKYASSG